MLLFSRILDIDDDQIKEVERRREQRYIPGSSFPLYATIEVEGEPRIVKVLDLSPGGAGLLVTGPTYPVGSPALLRLMLDEIWMEFPCRIAHIRTLPVGSRLGLAAEFDDAEAKKAYMQLLQPVAIGSLFRQVPAEEVRQQEPSLHRMEFIGRPDTELSVWRQNDVTGELLAFLWRMDDFVVQGDHTNPELEIYSRAHLVRSPRSKKKAPTYRKLPRVVKQELKHLFALCMMNLAKEIPRDIRSFLMDFTS